MTKVNDLLTKRFAKSSEKLSKMTDLAQRSTSGALSSFSGIFRITPLTGSEEQSLKQILDQYSLEGSDVAGDFKFLSAITSEVKAINNQAAILHGERIKKAQEVLKKYRDGAFSSWLVATYGNRQTPYNFLQYFEFYTSIPKGLQTKVDSMPRQAVYALATRDCDESEKTKVIEEYKGETKKELLEMIRRRFPLGPKDKRAPNLTDQVFSLVKELRNQLSNPRFKPTLEKRKQLQSELSSLLKTLGDP